MTPRQRRMTLVFSILAGVSIAGVLALSAFRQNVTFCRKALKASTPAILTPARMLKTSVIRLCRGVIYPLLPAPRGGVAPLPAIA